MRFNHWCCSIQIEKNRLHPFFDQVSFGRIQLFSKHSRYVSFEAMPIDHSVRIDKKYFYKRSTNNSFEIIEYCPIELFQSELFI